MAHVFTARSDRIMFFTNVTSSVGSFVNVKNATASKGTYAMIDDEILSKVTSIEEDEDVCEDTDEIKDLIEPPTKYEVMQALEVLKHAPFMMLMMEMRFVPK